VCVCVYCSECNRRLLQSSVSVRAVPLYFSSSHTVSAAPVHQVYINVHTHTRTHMYIIYPTCTHTRTHILCAPDPKSINPEKKTMSTRQRNVVRRGRRRYFFRFFFFCCGLRDYIFFFSSRPRHTRAYMRVPRAHNNIMYIYIILTHTHIRTDI